jgi:hypothetical protein
MKVGKDRRNDRQDARVQYWQELLGSDLRALLLSQALADCVVKGDRALTIARQMIILRRGQRMVELP